MIAFGTFYAKIDNELFSQLMKTKILFICFTLGAGVCNAQADITGYWKTLDDNTGKVRSVVQIEKREDVYFGKVVKLFLEPNDDPNPVCDNCDEEDDRYQQPVLGLEIIRNMKSDGSEYAGGNILDPENGNVYRCKIWTEKGNLMVRGYLAFFFRTQTWKRFSGEI